MYLVKQTYTAHQFHQTKMRKSVAVSDQPPFFMRMLQSHKMGLKSDVILNKAAYAVSRVLCLEVTAHNQNQIQNLRGAWNA